MRIALLSSALLLALAACGQAPEPVVNAEPVVAPAPAPTVAAAAADPFDAILAGSHRSDDNKARDQYRHPRETLAFFGHPPEHDGDRDHPGGGWYTEILAPYLRDAGKLVAAIWDTSAADASEYYKKSNQALADKFAANAAAFDQVELRSFDAKAPSFGDANSADAVVTFRNVHNWTMAGNDADYFKAFFSVLKPGGVLGVVEHRANAGHHARCDQGKRLPDRGLRDRARHCGRLRARREERDQRQCQGHQGSSRKACGRCRRASR